MSPPVQEPAGLGDRLGFEMLISSLSAGLVAAPEEAFQEVIESALRQVTEFFGADRGGMITVHPGQHWAHVLYAWYAEEFSSPIPRDFNLADAFPWAYHVLVERCAPHIVDRTDDQPPEAERDRANHRAMGVRSTLNIPIVVDAEREYIITIEALRREVHWPPSYVPRLQLLGAIFANTIERNRAAVALRESEARLALATQSAGAGAWDLDVGSGRIWATPEAKALYGLAPGADVTFDTFLAAVHPDDAGRVRDRVAGVVASESDFTEEYRVRLPGGEVRWVAALGRMRTDSGSSSPHLMGVSIDVTARKLAEETHRAGAARLQAAIDVAALGFYEVEGGERVTYIDDRCRTQFGVPEEQARGAAGVAFWIGHVHPEDCRRLLDLHEQLNCGALERVTAEYRYLNPERGLVWFQQVTHVLRRRADGFAQSTIGVVRDITEQKWREEALLASEEVNRATLEQAAVGIAHVATDGRWLRVNDRFCAIVGRAREELLEMSFQEMTHPDDLEAERGHLRSVLAGQPAVHPMEKRWVRKDGSVIWVGLAVSLVRDSAGHPKHYIAVMEDITGRKRAEQTLLKAHADVQRLRDQLERENVYLRQEATSLKGRASIVGRSSAIRDAMVETEKVAGTESTVLLLGETGTGKELFAAAIHELSPRRDRTMVRVNCAAIPLTLIESELFGRERGAYTGALAKQIGRFEMASGSTIFLDEIGDLPMDIQIKLLRVLQERQIERLGSPRPVPVDLRIITATNHDLERDVREGRFREDLYYRLHVFPIRVPPLRERLDDLPLLVESLVGELAGRMGKRVDSVSEASMRRLRGYSWPGNVRELRNVVERALILSTGSVLEIALPGVSRGAVPSPPEPGQASMDRERLLSVLQQTGWRIRGKNGAAERLGLKPTTLEARMARQGIRRP